MSPDLERHYRTLELPPGASPEEVKRAYHDLVQVWHPDRFAHSPHLQALAGEKLRALNAAYEALEPLAAEPPPAGPAPASAQPEEPAPPPRPEHPSPTPTPAAPGPEAATQYRTAPPAAVARAAPTWPLVRFVSRASVRTAGFVILFVGVLAGGRQLYRALLGPVQATESILQDAARLAGRPAGLSSPAVPGLALEVPGLGPIERFSRLWSTVPRQITERVAPSPAVLPERESAPERARTPRASGEGYLALPNGTELIPPRGKRGYGEVKILNGTETEAAAELVSESGPETPLRLVYIRAGAAVTVGGIGPGIYCLNFRLGEEWLPVSRDFARRRARGGPVGPLPFFQFQSAEGVRADSYEILLKPGAVPP